MNYNASREARSSITNDLASLQVNDVIEEHTFWVLTMILESCLPFDFYSNMVGCLVDQRVFAEIFRKKMPTLM